MKPKRHSSIQGRPEKVGRAVLCAPSARGRKINATRLPSRGGQRTARPTALAKADLRHCRALTVLEMLVSTTCLVFIVIGLTAMFVETQRAFKAGVKQNTMTDAGQTIIDMMGADLAQASDAQNPFITNLYWGWAAMNTSSNYQDIPANVYRTNQLQEIFVLVHTNTQWVGVGYAVSNYAGTGAGTLYSYLASTNDPLTNNVLCSNFIYSVYNQTFPTQLFPPGGGRGGAFEVARLRPVWERERAGTGAGLRPGQHQLYLSVSGLPQFAGRPGGAGRIARQRSIGSGHPGAGGV